MKLSAKERLIQAARQLFWKYGIKRITVEEICETAKVSKMTFYRNYKGKTDIVIEVLDRFYDESIEKFRAIMYSNKTFIEQVQGIVELKTESAKASGFEFIKEIATQDDSELQAYLFQKKQGIMGETFAWYAAAQKSGDIRADLDLRMLAYYTEQISKMAADESVMALYGSPENLIRELVKFFFYGISPIPSQK